MHAAHPPVPSQQQHTTAHQTTSRQNASANSPLEASSTSKDADQHVDGSSEHEMTQSEEVSFTAGAAVHVYQIPPTAQAGPVAAGTHSGTQLHTLPQPDIAPATDPARPAPALVSEALNAFATAFTAPAAYVVAQVLTARALLKEQHALVKELRGACDNDPGDAHTHAQLLCVMNRGADYTQ